jgi:hypothetical protein
VPNCAVSKNFPHDLKTYSAADALSANDFNSALKSVTTYAWLSAAGLFALYLYFVGAITFSVIKQESLSQQIKTVVSQTSREELKYLNLQKNLSEGNAQERGFIPAASISYVAPLGTFAWNVNAER